MHNRKHLTDLYDWNMVLACRGHLLAGTDNSTGALAAVALQTTELTGHSNV
jgi:hypothetical protein